MLFDTLDVHLVPPDEAAQIEGAAASVSIAVRHDDPTMGSFAVTHCSGFLISPRHALTAGHCVRPRLVLDRRHLAPREVPGGLEIVWFGSTPRLSFTGRSLSEHADAAAMSALGEPSYRSATLDFAVFSLPAPSAVADLPSAAFVDLVEASAAEEDADDEALQLYAYPNGVPLSVSVPCRSFPSPAEQLLFHDCDTLPGSSGGLLASATTGIAVAMHIGSPGRNERAYFERTGRFESPADLTSNPCGAGSGAEACFAAPPYNRALRLTAVAHDLKREAPALWAEILDASR